MLKKKKKESEKGSSCKRNNDLIMLRRKLSTLALILASTAVLFLLTYKLHVCKFLQMIQMDGDRRMIQYDRYMPVIIIGGVRHSGSDLLRKILDAHLEVRCDEEKAVNNLLLIMLKKWCKPKEKLNLEEGGVTQNVLDAAVAAFFLEMMARGGEPALRLCTDSTYMLRSAVYVSQVFPEAKFIFLVRDGRAVVHSLLSSEFYQTLSSLQNTGVSDQQADIFSQLSRPERLAVISVGECTFIEKRTLQCDGEYVQVLQQPFQIMLFGGYNFSDHRASLERWNNEVSVMYYQCLMVGNSRCMIVYHEELVLQPESSMKQVLSFLEVPWDESVLYYVKNYKRDFVLRYDTSDLKQVDTLTKWVDRFPLDVVQDMKTIAPMLITLGYEPTANTPNYVAPHSFLLHSNKNTTHENITTIFRKSS